MKNKLSKKTICLAAAAVVLVGTLSIGSALAYFSTYVLSGGQETLTLKFTETEVLEEVIEGKKILSIQNTGESPCYVRAKAIVADAYKNKISVTEPEGVDNWTNTPDAEGYYYYNPVLEAGEASTELYVVIDGITSLPGEDAEDFNVIVIQENTPVLYKDGGETYADWDGSEFIIEEEQEGAE